LEIGSGMAMLALSMYTLEAPRVAQLAQMAEHKYAHSPCGIMDQFICILGKPNQALLLDCRSLEHQYVPLPAEGCKLMVMNTQVKHSIGGGEYPVRVKQCKEGVGILQKGEASVQALRDANLDMLEAHRGEMDEVVYRRCRHVITENDRCQHACKALQAGELDTFGQLLYGSHYSLRDDYEVSCDELDAIVEVAAQIDGVYGSRMTGGGFGGCAIALIRPDAEENLRAAIREKYDGRFEKPAVVYTTQASAGAEIFPA
jgi:galactokinase